MEQLIRLRASILLATIQALELGQQEHAEIRRTMLQANHLVRSLLGPEQTQEALLLARRLSQIS